LIGLGLTFVILIGSAGLGAFLWSSSGGRSEDLPNSNRPKSSPTPLESPTVNPTPTVEDEGWVEHEDTQISEGDRITFYSVTTIKKCQDDCANNPQCMAFTYIKPGTYNPNDKAMCYLMSTVKTLSPAAGHFTGVKRNSQQ
jgi:hypothetical protein